MATKEQERKALARIEKIVADLGTDSYLGTAFEGCFEDARENIENDFACSYKNRFENACAHYEKVENEVVQLRAQVGIYEDEIVDLNMKFDEACLQLDSNEDHIRSLKCTIRDMANHEVELQDKLQKYETEILKLKARLYDLLCEEKEELK